MRVLVVIDSLAVGGAERSLVTVTPHLRSAGVDLHVAYLQPRTTLEQPLIEAGAVLHYAGGSGGRAGNVARLRRVMKEIRPDIVHTTLFESDFAGRVAAKLEGLPIVSSFVSEAYGPEHLNNPEYRRWKVRGAHIADIATARLADAFHAVSASTGDLMRQRLRVPNHTIVVVPRGRDPKTLGVRSPERAARARQSFGVEPGRPLILAAARHFHMKGLDILLRAFPLVLEAVPEATLLIAGREGPATPDLLRLIETGGVGDGVVVMGYRSDVPDLMTAADVFVLPSRAEGSPGVLIEALGLEAPTVASDIPSVREIAGGDPPVAVLSPLESIEDMARGIVNVIEDPGAARAMARAGRQRFLDSYTIEAVARQMKDFYERFRT